MAFVHVVTRVLLGIAVTEWPLHGTSLRWVSMVVVILAALIWGGLDGIRDARAYPGEDEGADLTMMWLKASVLAGLLAGAVVWVVGMVSDIALGENSLFFELTSGAAFTVLLVFIPATLGGAIGRIVVRREAKSSVAAPAAAGAAGAAESSSDDVYVESGSETVAYADENYAESDWTYEHGAGQQIPNGQYPDAQDPNAQGGYYQQNSYPEGGYSDPSADTEVFRAVQPQSDDTVVFPAIQDPGYGPQSGGNQGGGNGAQGTRRAD